MTCAAALVAYQAAGYLVFLMLGLVSRNAGVTGLRVWVSAIFSLAGAVAAGRYAWKRTGAAAASEGDRPSGMLAAMGRGALITGGIGFARGFFGPMIVTPDANQGPMLGIFITGPIGLVLGALGGAIWHRRRRAAMKA